MRGLLGLISYIFELGIEISPPLNTELSHLVSELCNS